MNIKEYIFHYKYRRQQKQQPRTPIYHSYRTVRRILLLFESDLLERNVQIKALIKQLQQDGKEVTAWGFVSGKKMAQSATLRDYRVLAQQDFTRLGWPQEQQIRDLQANFKKKFVDFCFNEIVPKSLFDFLGRLNSQPRKGVRPFRHTIFIIKHKI